MNVDLLKGQIETISQNKKSKRAVIEIALLVFLLIVALFVYSLFSLFASVETQEDISISIPEGYSVSEAANLLESEGLIRSKAALKISSRVNPLVVKSGNYQFDQGVYTLADIRERLTNAEFGDIYTSITIPEGSSREQIALILERSLLGINATEFLALSRGKEGYLFPDTYFFLPDDGVQEVIDELSETFEEKIDTLQVEVDSSTRSFEDIVIMASILEKESTGNIQEMRTISGILWKRIDKGIPLQVDAPFLFAKGKTSAQLRTSDLRADGSYNTYTNKGLTPTAIGNPGLDALRAAIEPLDSLYFFYLHDTNSDIHYGVTHDDHVRNKNNYLR